MTGFAVALVLVVAAAVILRWRRPAFQRSDLERQQEVASGLDDLVRTARKKADQRPSGADLVRDP
ncbi:hypothetical protein [Streptomyces sp. NPDC001876]|uniref:hypothetical protein n=1 Tax=Streptomyces sp. NPDC001876 TaxID=3154402 RepID=UPI00331D9530